jgi:hypothetical protein
VHSGEASVSRRDGVATRLLEVSEEADDERCVEIRQCKLGGCLADVVPREGEQQTERVAVGRDGVRTRVSLLLETLGKECLDHRGERAHGSAPSARSTFLATRSMSSGVAEMYQ